MTDADDRDEPTPATASNPSTAEREGIVDQQDAILSAIEEVEAPDDDPMAGEAPTG